MNQSNRRRKRSVTPLLKCILVMMLLIVGCFIKSASAASGGDEPHVFSTWEGFEADKCASIWLIKRFVDREASFRFFPKEETPMAGIPFDTPDAQLRRYHNRSTFESILVRYHIADRKLIHLGRIVHDIEINLWEKKVMPETAKVQEALAGIIKNAKDNEEVIEKTMEYFDAFYGKLPAEPKSP